MFNIKRGLVSGLIAATCLISTGVHAADSYPEKHVKLVVPYPAGGTTDLIARLYADRLNSSSLSLSRIKAGQRPTSDQALLLRRVLMGTHCCLEPLDLFLTPFLGLNQHLIRSPN
jgi:hypothetical protein